MFKLQVFFFLRIPNGLWQKKPSLGSIPYGLMELLITEKVSFSIFIPVSNLDNMLCCSKGNWLRINNQGFYKDRDTRDRINRIFCLCLYYGDIKGQRHINILSCILDIVRANKMQSLLQWQHNILFLHLYHWEKFTFCRAHITQYTCDDRVKDHYNFYELNSFYSI